MNEEWAGRALAQAFQVQPTILEDEKGRRVSVYLLELDGTRLLAETPRGELVAGTRLITRISDPTGSPWIMPLRVDMASAFSQTRDRVALSAQQATPDVDVRRTSRTHIDLPATLTTGRDAEKAAVRIVDLSPLGVGVVTPDDLGLSVGDPAALAASLGAHPLDAMIDVRAIRAEPAGGWFLGCAFTALSLTMRRTIERFLAGDDAPPRTGYRDLYRPSC